MIFITGGNGFLGRHILPLLAGNGQQIRATYRNDSLDELQSTFPLVDWVQGDLLDTEWLAEVMQPATMVIHTAATVSFDVDDTKALLNNSAITANVVNESIIQGVSRFVHISSVATFGRAENNHFIDEDTEWNPDGKNSLYAQSKFEAEMEVWRGYAEGLPVAILNPGIILGEGDWRKGSAHLIDIVYKGLKYYTEGVNAWVDVKDVAQAAVDLLNSPIIGEQFILSAGNYSYKEVFQQMAQSLNVTGPQKGATTFQANLLWRLLKIRKLLTGKSATITKETAQTAMAQYNYKNDKWLQNFPHFIYTPLPETINRMAEAYLNSLK